MKTAADNMSPVVLVTGGARRIGAEICRQFASAGWRVAIHCRHSADEAQRLAVEIGESSSAVFTADLCANAEREALCSEVKRHFGRIDVLVNNASAYVRQPMGSVTADTLRRDLDINFTSPFALMCDFRREVSAAGGLIVNILDSRIAWPDGDSAGYTLAKSALSEGTVLCAREWASAGIRVNGIAPGFVMPPDGVPMERMQHLVETAPLKRRTTPEEIADTVLWLLRTPSITGQILFLDGGLHLPSGGKGEKI